MKSHAPLQFALAASLALAGCDGKSELALFEPGGSSSYSTECDKSQHAGIALDAIAAEFSTRVQPLLTRDVSGCTGCHAPSSSRLFKVSADGVQTFHQARAAGYLSNQPGSLLDRLTTTDPLARMPKGFESWRGEEVQAVADIACKLSAYQAASATLADEEFPPDLLTPYNGPAANTYDNTFLGFLQLKGRVKQVFNDTWVRGAEDRFAKNIGLFGGVDFQTYFVEARAATPEFFLGMDALSKDVCSQAVTNKTGPFTGVDPSAAIVDTPPSQTQQVEAEAMANRPANGGVARSGIGIYANGTLSHSINFPGTGSYTFTVRAQQDLAPPDDSLLDLQIDATTLTTFTVTGSATYAEYTFTANVTGGSHLLALTFTNDGRGTANEDRNVYVDWVKVVGPAGAGTGTTRVTAARSAIGNLYSRMLYRTASTEEVDQSYALVKDLSDLNVGLPSAWSGLCEALMRHPDFLFAHPPSRETASEPQKTKLLLVGLAQDLTGRPPTGPELEMLANGKTFAEMVDYYFGLPEFRDYYFHKMRIRTESDGTIEADEPARLWTYLMLTGQPFQELLTSDYGIDTAWTKVARPAVHGRSGVLTMAGFIKNKQGLPHYNYAARVMTDFMGVVFQVPPEVFEQRATSTASSTVDTKSLCFSCHQNLTPLATQRLRWDDNGNYREVDGNGAPIDDSDRGLVAGYAFKGQGMAAFGTQAVRKEAFVRRMLNAHYQLLIGREMRHLEDERSTYQQLWDVSQTSSGDLKAVMKAILLSPAYQRN